MKTQKCVAEYYCFQIKKKKLSSTFHHSFFRGVHGVQYCVFCAVYRVRSRGKRTRRHPLPLSYNWKKIYPKNCRASLRSVPIF